MGDMAIVKYAELAILDAEVAQVGGALIKHAHRHSFEYDPKPGFLYVRSRAISSRCNDNFDEFPAPEIKAAWKSFIGRPVFVNHKNDDHKRARGVIIDAALHEDTNPDGSPDTWVEVLMEVDAIKFPKLAKAILDRSIERTSMGTDVEYSVCSACGNRARTPLEYCFLPGTLVTMADGTLKPIELVEAGDRVLTHDGPGVVTAPMERHYNGPMSRLHRAGYAEPLYLTHGHHVRANLVGRRDAAKSGEERYSSVHADDNWGWLPSERIEAGNWVQGAYPVDVLVRKIHPADLAPDLEERDGRAVLVSPYASGRRIGLVQYGKNGLSAEVSNDDDALGFIMGLWAAEGSLEVARTAAGTPKCVSWSLGVHEHDLVHDLEIALGKVGAGEPRVYARGGGIQVRLSNAPLAALLQAWVGTGAKTKHLSAEIMLAPHTFQRAFLDAYYRGDGWDDPRGHVEVRTVGGLLARQLVMLGARVEPTIPSWWKNTHNPGGPTNRAALGEVHHLGMGRGGPMKGRRRMGDGYYANRIVQAEHDYYHGTVYNFEVEGQHSYVAEGVVVHNCAHIPKMKGKRLRRHTASGSTEDVLVREICYGLRFFENSLLVEDPADPTAYFLGVDASGLSMQAGVAIGGGGSSNGVTVVGSTAAPAVVRPLVATAGRTAAAKRLYVRQLVQGDSVNLGGSMQNLLIERIEDEGEYRRLFFEQRPYGPPERGLALRLDEPISVNNPGRRQSVPDEPSQPTDLDAAYKANCPACSKYVTVRNQKWVAHNWGNDRCPASGQSDDWSYLDYSRSKGWTGARVAKVAARAGYVVIDTGMLQRRDAKTAFELHIAGCGDISQPKYRGCDKHQLVDADSWQEALEMWIDPMIDQDQGYTYDDVRVLPCAKTGIPVTQPQLDPSLCAGSGQELNNPNGRLYLPCPVCGASVGTGRGVVPRHKKQSEFFYGEIGTGTYPDIKYVKHIATNNDQALCGAGEIESGKPMKADPVRGTCPACVSMWRENMAKGASRVAFGEPKAPAEVNTLREATCPVCGEDDTFDGDKCMVCGYMKPPDQFMDPDLDKAKETDLRQDKELSEMDGTVDLTCDACGATVKGHMPTKTAAVAQPAKPPSRFELKKPKDNGEVDPPEDETDENEAEDKDEGKEADPKADTTATTEEEIKGDGSKEPAPDAPLSGEPPVGGEDESTLPQPGDQCPECGKGTLSAPDSQPEQGEQPEEEGGKPAPFEKAEGEPDDPEKAEKPKKDDTEEVGGSDDKGDKEDEGDDQDEDKKDKSKKPWPPKAEAHRHGAYAPQQKEQTMRPVLKAAAEQQIQVDALNAKLARVASLAGIDFSDIDAAANRRLASLKRQAAGEEAPVETAAQDWPLSGPSDPPFSPPSPPSTAPSSTTEEARTPDANIDLMSGGTVLSDTSADATIDLMAQSGRRRRVAEVLPPATPESVDVTAPVAGTEAPPADAQLLEDIRTGEPVDNTPMADDNPNWNGTTGSKTYAALRLARLRLQAEIAESSDDISEAMAIEAAMDEKAINAEISTLSRVVTTAAARPSAPRPAPAGRRPSIATLVNTASQGSGSTVPGNQIDSALFE